MRLPTDEVLARLKDFSTASVSNVVATYPTHPLCLWLYDPWESIVAHHKLKLEKQHLLRKEVKCSIQNDLTNEPIILIFEPNQIVSSKVINFWI